MTDLNIPEAVERAQAIIERHNSCEYCSGARTLEEFCSEKRQSETVLVLASLMERLTEEAYWVSRYNHGPDCKSCAEGHEKLRRVVAEARTALKGRE